MKPIHSPLPATVAPSLPIATTPCRPTSAACTPHIQHQQLPPEDTSYATWCHTPASDDNLGPEQGGQHGISRVFPLGTPALCYPLPLETHHCRGQASRAASPSASSPQCCLWGSPLSYSVSQRPHHHVATRRAHLQKVHITVWVFSAPEAQKDVVGWQLSRYHTAALNPSLLQQQANTDQITRGLHVSFNNLSN